jgi:tripartite-type tricarboxylate transporter receptor subunit TctC
VRFPHIMAAHPSLPAKTVAELIALARSSPDKVNVASYGTGTTSHLAGELFKSLAGIDFVHVPYRGDAQAMPDLLSGRVQIYCDTNDDATLYTVRCIARVGSNRQDSI